MLEARTQASVALFKLGAHSATLRPEFGGPKSLRCCCAKGAGRGRARHYTVGTHAEHQTKSFPGPGQRLHQPDEAGGGRCEAVLGRLRHRCAELLGG